MSVTTAAPAAKSSQPQLVMPFSIGARQETLSSFSVGPITLAAAAPTPLSPISIPPNGYLRGLMLEVTVTGTGGTAPAFIGDGALMALQSIGVRDPAGRDFVVPVDGYTAYLMAKWGGAYSQGAACDLRANSQYSATAPSAHFFLPIWFEIDSDTGLGSLPNLSASQTLQLNVTLAAISSFISGVPTSVTVTINGTAYFWNAPPASTASGTQQQTQPPAAGGTAIWQMESQSITPGEKAPRLSNVGNVLRTLIFVLRNSSGARIDSSWPAIFELKLDNNVMFHFSSTEFKRFMAAELATVVTTEDSPGGIDAGVYVIPFHALAGGPIGDPANSRAQLLPTLDAAALNARGASWGASASSLQIITQSVTGVPSNVLFAK
jgi:hypothetical protein